MPCTICPKRHGLQYNEAEYKQKFGNERDLCIEGGFYCQGQQEGGLMHVKELEICTKKKKKRNISNLILVLSFIGQPNKERLSVYDNCDIHKELLEGCNSNHCIHYKKDTSPQTPLNPS